MTGLRQHLGALKRFAFPRPEVRAWRRAVDASSRTPRYTNGRIRLLDYEIEYTDLLTLCPQWNELFVKEAYRFESSSESPRVLDLGANVGLASLYFKRLYPSARITAYEADPAIFAVLERNLSANGASDIDTVHAAAWTHDGTVDFDREGADSGAVTNGHGRSERTQPVPARRLRSVLEAEQFDLVKLDIEGAELTVLRDSRDALANVSALVMEVHEWSPDQRVTPNVLELLDDAGFQYGVDELAVLPWRKPVAPEATPFAGRALCWAYLVRAWKP